MLLFLKFSRKDGLDLSINRPFKYELLNILINISDNDLSLLFVNLFIRLVDSLSFDTALNLKLKICFSYFLNVDSSV